MTQPEHVQTAHPGRKLGRLPNNPAKPRLTLAPFLRDDYKGAVPGIVDYSDRVADWPMYGNDRLGDCTAAAAGHAEEVWSVYGTGSLVEVTDQDVIDFYSGSTGYNPADPSTDQGGVMQDVMTYWRREGIAGHQIAAFFELNPHDLDEVRAALWLFGGVNVGLAFPAFAMDQFEAGQPWDISRHNTRIEGGHDVWLVGMDDAGTATVVTWGRLQKMTPAFWARYVAANRGEAWAVCSLEWTADDGVSPAGLDTAALNAAFQELTGEPGPFPVAPPTPPPSPVPSPAPADDADQALIAAIDEWRRAKGYDTPNVGGLGV